MDQDSKNWGAVNCNITLSGLTQVNTIIFIMHEGYGKADCVVCLFQLNGCNANSGF